MRRAFFGGSFDPVHVGHMILAQEVLEQTEVEQVVFVPARVPPHKQDAELSDGRHRLAMVRLAVAGQAGLAASDVELARAGVSYTIDTLESLARETPDDWSVIIGADQMLEIESWRRYDDIFANFPVLLATRAGVPRNKSRARLYERATLVQVPAIEISSTAIRRRVAEGRRIAHWVPPAVEAYIARHGLYRAGQLPSPQRPRRSSGRHG